MVEPRPSSDPHRLSHAPLPRRLAPFALSLPPRRPEKVLRAFGDPKIRDVEVDAADGGHEAHDRTGGAAIAVQDRFQGCIYDGYLLVVKQLDPYV